MSSNSGCVLPMSVVASPLRDLAAGVFQFTDTFSTAWRSGRATSGGDGQLPLAFCFTALGVVDWMADIFFRGNLSMGLTFVLAVIKSPSHDIQTTRAVQVRGPGLADLSTRIRAGNNPSLLAEAVASSTFLEDEKAGVLTDWKRRELAKRDQGRYGDRVGSANSTFRQGRYNSIRHVVR